MGPRPCGCHRAGRGKPGPHVGGDEFRFPLGRRSRRHHGLQEPEGDRCPGHRERNCREKGRLGKAVKLHLSLLGANNQHVVPNSPSPGPSTSARAPDGWPPRAAGGEHPTPPSKQGPAILTSSTVSPTGPTTPPISWGTGAWQYTVRGNGCTSCPIRCHTLIKVPAVAAKYGISENGQNTCGGLNFGRTFFRNFPDGPRGQTTIEACMVGMHMADDLGIWNNYSQLQRDFIKLYYDGTIKSKLGRRSSRATRGTNTKREIPRSYSSSSPESRTRKENWGRSWGWAPGYHPGAVGDFRGGMEKRSRALNTGKWATPSTIPTKTRASPA